MRAIPLNKTHKFPNTNLEFMARICVYGAGAQAAYRIRGTTFTTRDIADIKKIYDAALARLEMGGVRASLIFFTQEEFRLIRQLPEKIRGIAKHYEDRNQGITLAMTRFADNLDGSINPPEPDEPEDSQRSPNRGGPTQT